MSSISDDELKKRGILAIEAALANSSEALISVKGKARFVVIPLELFQYLRECELESMLAQTKVDLQKGNISVCSPEQHLERVKPCKVKHPGDAGSAS